MSYTAQGHCIVCKQPKTCMGPNVDDAMRGLGDGGCRACGGMIKLELLTRTVNGKKEIVADDRKGI